MYYIVLALNLFLLCCSYSLYCFFMFTPFHCFATFVCNTLYQYNYAFILVLFCTLHPLFTLTFISSKITRCVEVYFSSLDPHNVSLRNLGNVGALVNELCGSNILEIDIIFICVGVQCRLQST